MAIINIIGQYSINYAIRFGKTKIKIQRVENKNETYEIT
jgi:hypothetical protein